MYMLWSATSSIQRIDKILKQHLHIPEVYILLGEERHKHFHSDKRITLIQVFY
jgi:hypothetical protein